MLSCSHGNEYDVINKLKGIARQQCCKYFHTFVAYPEIVYFNHTSFRSHCNLKKHFQDTIMVKFTTDFKLNHFTYTEPTSLSRRVDKSLKTALFFSFKSSFQSSMTVILKVCSASQIGNKRHVLVLFSGLLLYHVQFSLQQRSLSKEIITFCE